MLFVVNFLVPMLPRGNAYEIISITQFLQDFYLVWVTTEDRGNQCIHNNYP